MVDFAYALFGSGRFVNGHEARDFVQPPDEPVQRAVGSTQNEGIKLVESGLAWVCWVQSFTICGDSPTIWRVLNQR